jgi:osmoprotectant transport system substrate-binding protein
VRPRIIVASALTAAALLAACGSDNNDNNGGSATTTAAATTETTAAETTTSASAAEETTTSAQSAETTAAAAAGAEITFKPLDSAGPLTIAALNNGDIQIAAIFTTFTQPDWVVLEDDKNLQPVQNLVVVGRKDKLDDATAAVLDPVMAKLTTDELSALNRQVGDEKKDPADVAKSWLDANGLMTSGTSLNGKSFTVGSANFSEQEIVSSLVSQVLKANGANVSEKFKLGSREVVAPALEKGDIDVYVEYVGAYLNFLGGTPSGDLDKSYADLKTAADAKGIVVLKPAPADDKDGLAVLKATADKYSLSKISDLTKVTDSLTFGGPPECPQRDFCIKGYEKVYGLKFKV